jgi:hypothetical protein
MDAIIGRYQICIEQKGLTLTHPTNFSFALTIDETLRLAAFINIYKSALIATQHDKEPTTKENYHKQESKRRSL